MRKRVFVALAALSPLPLGSCNNLPIALGDETSIIAAVSPELWAEIESDLVPALERTVFTVRDEKTFLVTHHDPGDEMWPRLRRFKQQLVIGKAGDPWMADVLEESDFSDSGGLFQEQNVWARGQSVTALLLEDGEDPRAAVDRRAAEIWELYDSQYRDWVRSKMFVTGPNDELSETLQREAGFNMVVPNVYDYTVADSVHIFRNDNPDPSELIRQVSVTWQSPVPEGLQGGDLLEWRARIVDEYYSFPQVVNRDRMSASPALVDGHEAYTIRAVWENPPDAFPAAGPFVMRAVVCQEQDRMYLIDAWLYAPGREKYEYVIQLDNIVNSFSCEGL